MPWIFDDGVEAGGRTHVIQTFGAVPSPESSGRLELAARLQRSWALLRGMPAAWALAETLIAMLIQAESPERECSHQASGGLGGLVFEEVGDGMDLVIRVGDGNGHRDARAGEEGGVALSSGEDDPVSSTLSSVADLCEEAAQGGSVSLGEVVLPGVVDLQDGHDDSSSVGGDGATGGDQAPSPVGGDTDPTEEAQSSKAASAEEQVSGHAASRLENCEAA